MQKDAVYTKFATINQQILVENNLTLKHGVVLSWMRHFDGSPKCEKLIEDSITYYWFSPKKISSDLPALGSRVKNNEDVFVLKPASVRSIINLVNDLIQAGLLIRHEASQSKRKSFITYTEKLFSYYEASFTVEANRRSQLHSEYEPGFTNSMKLASHDRELNSKLIIEKNIPSFFLLKMKEFELPKKDLLRMWSARPTDLQVQDAWKVIANYFYSKGYPKTRAKAKAGEFILHYDKTFWKAISSSWKIAASQWTLKDPPTKYNQANGATQPTYTKSTTVSR
jgi:hypothetical protein